MVDGKLTLLIQRNVPFLSQNNARRIELTQGCQCVRVVLSGKAFSRTPLGFFDEKAGADARNQTVEAICCACRHDWIALYSLRFIFHGECDQVPGTGCFGADPDYPSQSFHPREWQPGGHSLSS